MSISYIRRLEKLPTLESQGDGMRAFVGVLLHAFAVEHSAVLIDEPEAFLHPPQARLLGRMLVDNAPKNRQLVIATHSGDLLRGLLDADSGRVRIIRIEREGDVNPIAELENSRIRKLWNDPLLRYSDVLNGIFHKRVIVCESDADCRFYAAIKDAVSDASEGVDDADIMFIHAGGKERVPLVAGSLHHLKVPVTAICDFDILNFDFKNKETSAIYRVIESLGGDFTSIESDLRLVSRSIGSKKAELKTEEVKRLIEAELQKVQESSLPEASAAAIRRILSQSSPWAIAKTVGKSFVPSGDPSEACDRLLASLASIGLYVVHVGELEGWCRSVGGKGPKWTNKVLLEQDLDSEELEPARKFVRKILGNQTNDDSENEQSKAPST